MRENERERSLQEAESRVARALSKVEDCRRRLYEALEDLKEAKSEANELVIGGVVHPLVHYMSENASRTPPRMSRGPELSKSLWVLGRVCTTTQRAVCGHVQRLVFHSSREADNIQLGGEILQISRRFPKLTHVVVDSEMSAKHSISLESAPGSLHTFDVGGRGRPSYMEHLTVCQSLQVVRLVDCGSLRSIHALHMCSNLRELDIWDCPALQCSMLGALQSCTSLQKLRLQYPNSLEAFDCGAFRGMTRMEHLGLRFQVRFYGISPLKDISRLPGCPALKELEFRGGHRFPDEAFNSLELCSGLRKLAVADSILLHELPDLQSSVELTDLDLRNCCSLSSIASLALCKALKNLLISSCPALPNETFKALELCVGLRAVCYEECYQLQELPSHRACTKLSEISIMSCANLYSIATLPSCPALKALELVSCEALSNEAFKALESCTRLQRLVLDECEHLEKLPDMRCCLQLAHISITRCRKLLDISSLACCPAVKTVSISRCNAIPTEALHALHAHLTLKVSPVYGCNTLPMDSRRALKKAARRQHVNLSLDR